MAPTKTGGYSGACGACGVQMFAKTPRAARMIADRLEPQKPAAPAEPPADKGAGRRRPADDEVFGR